MQQTSETATVGARSDGGDAAPAQLAVMLNVGDVAEMLRCSGRTVYRLADSGRMPRPVKLGALVRWNRAAVEAWITEGCPNLRSNQGAANRKGARS